MAILKIKRPAPPRNAAEGLSNEPRTKKNARDDDIRNLQTEPTPTRKRIKVKSNQYETPKIKIQLSKEQPPQREFKVKIKKDADAVRGPRVRLKPIRVPGEGYDSEASDIEADPLIESGIILRVLPDTQVDFVRNSIEAGDYSGINIKWKSERHSVVTINGYMYGAILVDLPTVIEVNKSVDRKNLLKTFDLCQMLLCIKMIESEDEVFGLQVPDSEDLTSKHFEHIQDEIDTMKMTLLKRNDQNKNHFLSKNELLHLKEIATKSYDYKHGLTAPLYNVRNRRFRRKMSPVEFEYVNNVVDMLLNDDDGAEEITYELITEEEINTKPIPMASQSQFFTPAQQQFAQINKIESVDDNISKNNDNIIANAIQKNKGIENRVEMEDEEDDLDLEAAFESDEDADESNTNKINMDQVGEGEEEEEEDQEEEDEEEEEDDEEEEEDDDEDEEDDDEEEEEREGTRTVIDENKQHLELLGDELKELESALQHTTDKMRKATNPLLKSRFQDSIKKLEKELESKRKQFKSSQELVNQSNAANMVNRGITPEPSNLMEDESDGSEESEEVDGDEDEEDDTKLNGPDNREESPGAANLEDIANDTTVNDNAETPEQLDDNDLDMMLLFGGEADDD